MILVLRIGHRPERDKRLTTHVCLVARAFGADGVIIGAEEDEHVKNSVEDIVARWGGPFFIRFESKWRRNLKEWEGKIIHLTMYGIPIDEVIDEIRKHKNLMVVVGGEKVPREVYNLADYNVAIGNQPHSEVAALSIFLDRFFNGKELNREFKDAKLRIVPQEKGKMVEKLE